MTLKEAEEQSGLSYEEWEELTFEYLFSGGTVEGFTKAMGLSESAQNVFEDEFEVQNQPRRPTPRSGFPKRVRLATFRSSSP